MHHATNLDWLTKQCAKANSFSALVPIAIQELRKFPDGSEMVCGPISTGGRGSPEINLTVFDATIRALQQEGRPIFNQIPYEGKILHLRTRWQAESPANADRYCMPILEEFYRPIINTGLIKKGWFIPGWESSTGARWERNHLTESGVPIVDLADTWINRALALHSQA